MTPVDEGIEAARRDAEDMWEGWDDGQPASMEPGLRHYIGGKLQTWNTDLLVEMERWTHGEGRDLIRRELANRGTGRNGQWVGYEEAKKTWFPEGA